MAALRIPRWNSHGSLSTGEERRTCPPRQNWVCTDSSSPSAQISPSPERTTRQGLPEPRGPQLITSESSMALHCRTHRATPCWVQGVVMHASRMGAYYLLCSPSTPIGWKFSEKPIPQEIMQTGQEISQRSIPLPHSSPGAPCWLPGSLNWAQAWRWGPCWVWGFLDCPQVIDGGQRPLH